MCGHGRMYRERGRKEGVGGWRGKGEIKSW